VTRTFAFTVALVALLLAGCGGTKEEAVTKQQYEQRLDQIGLDLYDAANELGESTATQAFNDGIGKLQDVLEDGADELDGVLPPGAAAQAANDRLVAAYRDLADEFDKVKDARRESFPRALRALQAVQTSAPARATLRAAADLRKLGFKVPVSTTIGVA
jgi:hypothetical protein